MTWGARTALPVVSGALAFALTVVALHPGWLSFDSSSQFWQARTGQFLNLSPVVMTALWSLVHRIVPSPAAMLVLHLAAYWIGVVLLALALGRGAATRTLCVVAVGGVPPALVVLGHLWTDASLIAAMTLASGLVAAGFVHGSRVALWAALPVLVYAGAVRHNSLLAIVPLAALWAHAWFSERRAASRATAYGSRRARVAGMAALVVLASWLFGAGLDRALARERVSTWAIGALWDLAAISIETGEMVVPPFARTPGTDLASLKAKYTPFVGVPMFDGPGRLRHGLHNEVFVADELAALRGAWLRAIARHPAAFAHHRLEVTTRLFGRYDSGPESLFFVPQVVPYRDNPPPAAPLAPGLRASLVDVLRDARGTWLFSPAPYLAVALGALACGIRRRARATAPIALALSASALLLVLPLVVFAPSAEMRYCGWMFTASVAALAACIVPGVQGAARNASA